jgi:hypothetical protein
MTLSLRKPSSVVMSSLMKIHFPGEDWISSLFGSVASDSAHPKVSSSPALASSLVPLSTDPSSDSIQTNQAPTTTLPSQDVPIALEQLAHIPTTDLLHNTPLADQNSCPPSSHSAFEQPLTNSDVPLLDPASTAYISSLQPIVSSPVSSETEPLPPSTNHSTHPMITRSQDGTRQPKTFSPYKLFSFTKHHFMALHSHLSFTTLPLTPSRFSQAVTSPHWQQAMQEEFTALQANQT